MACSPPGSDNCRREVSQSTALRAHSCTGRINSITGLKIAIYTRRRRKAIDIDLLVTKPNSSLVEPSERLLKPSGLGVTGWYGPLDDVQLTFVHVDCDEAAGLVRIGELHLVPFNEV